MQTEVIRSVLELYIHIKLLSINETQALVFLMLEARGVGRHYSSSDKHCLFPVFLSLFPLCLVMTFPAQCCLRPTLMSLICACHGRPTHSLSISFRRTASGKHSLTAASPPSLKHFYQLTVTFHLFASSQRLKTHHHEKSEVRSLCWEQAPIWSEPCLPDSF